MKLRRAMNLLSEWLKSTVIVAVVVAMLISLMPALSSPAAAWSLPNPRMVEGRWNLEVPGSHINQTLWQVSSVAKTLGRDHWISRGAADHFDDLVRGNLWADDYPQHWARRNPMERVVTWGQFFQAAGFDEAPDNWAAFCAKAFEQEIPDEVDWLLTQLISPARMYDEHFDDPAYFPEVADARLDELFANLVWRGFWWAIPTVERSDIESRIKEALRRAADQYIGVIHPDYSLYHLYDPEDWFQDLIGYEGNAVSRAEFWYWEAVRAYETHGTTRFPDPFSEFDLWVDDGDVPWITAYDYLGRALHYLQDLAQPAHSSGTYRHIPLLWIYEDWSSRNTYPSRITTGTDWPEEASGEYFAWRTRQAIDPFLELWQDLTGGMFVGLTEYRAQDAALAAAAPYVMHWSIYFGAGMLIRFHQQIEEFVEPEPWPPDDYRSLAITVEGEGFTLPAAGVHAYEYDDEVTVMAVPAEGWQFVGWTGAVESPSDTIVVEMTEDKLITAVFEMLPVKFSVGNTVSTIAPLNVRDEPGLGTNVIRTQPGDTAGVILSAEGSYPVFSHGYTWWLVEYDDGTTGWSSDHRLEEYARPTPRFSVGDYVVTTDELYVRSEPRLTDEYGNYFVDNVIATHPPGMRGKVRDSEEPRPRRVMGYDLWEIEWEDGTVGWSSDHRLAPVEVAHSIDVFMLVDLSGSFSDDLPYFKVQAPDLMASLKSSYPDIRFGLGKFEDYPISPFGSAACGDKAYERLIDLTFDTDAVLSTISGLYTRSGADGPESQLVALYQAATGEGQDLSGVGYPGASIPAGQQANFRDGVVKLFILWTDAPFHHPGDPGSVPYPGPSFEETVEAILALDPPMVIGISSGGGGLADLRAIAAATNAVAPPGGVDTNGDGVVDIPEGEPLVASIGYSGQGITAAIESLTTAAVMLPIASAGGPYTGKVGETIVFDGSGSFDPDGWIVQYEWDFDSDGTFDFSSAEPTAEYAYPAAFSGIATLRVTDDAGNTAIGTAPVEVTLIPSTYKFEYSVPDPIVVATDVDIDVTFMTDEEGDIGYDGVRFRFEIDGPGDVTLRATDSEGVEHPFMNSGFWGPSAGFDLPASYDSTTTWTLNFLEKAGNYTITFSLVEAPDGDVIADITETVTVTVKPLPAEVTIDPETLNLQAPGKWITAYIELPEEYAAEDIDVGTVQLIYGDSELYADWGDVQDGVFMAKFDWATVAGWFDGLHDVDVELTVAGEVAGVEFEGVATIRVIDPPRPRRR